MQRLEKQRHDHAATEIQRIWQGYKVRNANKPKGKKGKKGKKVRRPRPRRPTTLPPAQPPPTRRTAKRDSANYSNRGSFC